MNHRSRQPARRTAFRRGFTLLEVLLALGLSVLLLAAVGMAVDFHLRLLNTGRAEVEQAQLARAILRRIADDLRGALQYTPAATTSDAASDGDSGDAGESGNVTIDESVFEDQQMIDRTSNLANASSLPTLPGIYGNDRELQIDVSRLPRLDQMRAVLAGAGSTDPTIGVSAEAIGDLRCVLYYVEGASSGPQPLGGGGGLLRREIDRASASLAMEQGESLQTQEPDEPMAPEVQDVQFRYFDGTEWVETWDTTDRSGLPMAVYITLTLVCPQKARSAWSASAGDEMNPETRTYQLLVHLPAARATTSISTTTSTTSDSTTTQQP